jgi:hypothetical protein
MSKDSYIIIPMPNFARPLRPLLWVASSKRDYDQFPARVQETMGFELFLAQTGQYPPSAKLLRGLGSGTVELIEDFAGDTYRAVTPCVSLRRSTSCMPSKRSRSGAVKRRRATLI